MGCRCNERREALKKALDAAAHGDTTEIKTELKFVAASSFEDAGIAARGVVQTLKTKAAQARMHLGALRR